MVRPGRVYVVPTPNEGVVVGGEETAITYIPYGCGKPLLPRHPVPSTANYGPANVAPIAEFFGAIVGQPMCNIVLRYENNTPCDPEDDILVQHAICSGLPYESPKYACDESQKSEELRRYEEYAKKSARLKEYMETSPAQIEYFNDLCFKE